MEAQEQAHHWNAKFVNYLRVEKNYSPATQSNYERSVILMINDLERAGILGRWETLSVKQCQNLVIEWLRVKSRRSVHNIVSGLVHFFQYLKREGEVTKNPWKQITLPKMSKALPVFLSESQVNRLLDQPKELMAAGSLTEAEAVRDQLIFELLYGLGLRISELVKLEAQRVFPDEMEIRVIGKGNKERICPMHPGIRELIELYWQLGAKRAGRLLKGETDKELTTYWVQKRLKYYLKLAGLPMEITPHKLRHSFATHLLGNGASLRTVQQLLGHKHLSSTQVYTHLNFKKLAEVHQLAHPRG